MKVTYIEHSGFLLDTGDVYFLFDYYKGILPKLDKKKPLVVFVSHKHQDHFNPWIFSLADMHLDTLFILAKGVPYKNLAVKFSKQLAAQGLNSILPLKKDISTIIMLSNGKELKIRTLRSTDEGVAFLLSYKGRRYYHAGDLNLWVLDGEDEQENKNMEKKYFTEMEKLKGMDIEIAFVPLDPRLQCNAYCGLKTFLSYTNCQCVFPMHFWGKYGIIDAFLERYPEYTGIVKRITSKNQKFFIKKENLL